MTTSSTWTCESSGRVLGCGIDAERIARFRAEGGFGTSPWTALFTAREIAHNRQLEDPALGFCASFCSKEAVVKSLGEPIDYRDCELLLEPGQELQELRLAPRLCKDHGVVAWSARALQPAERDECVVVVVLFGAADPRR